MKCYVPCTKCSYYYVAEVSCDVLTFNVFDAEYCVDDQYYFLMRFRSVKPDCTLWGDSMADPFYYRWMAGWGEFLVASSWNYEYWRKAGFEVVGVKRRPIPRYEIAVTKKYSFVTVGVSRYFDRKNLSLIPELGIGNSTRILGRVETAMGIRDGRLVPVNAVQGVDPFDMNRYEIHREMASARFYLALSVSEGIGLPPLEAMQYGVVPIYVDGHGYKENLTGLPVAVKNEFSVNVVNYWFRVWEPDLRELKYEIGHALTMSKDEYDDLSEKVKKKANDYPHVMISENRPST